MSLHYTVTVEIPRDVLFSNGLVSKICCITIGIRLAGSQGKLAPSPRIFDFQIFMTQKSDDKRKIL